MTPWLTVAIPVHNGTPLLDAALAGIAAENPEGVEVLILNSAEDGGAARRIADSYAGRIAIAWYERPDLTNWTYKANVAARLASAPHFSVLCHDDFWLPGHLDSVRRSLTRHPDAVMSVAPARFAGPDGKLLGPWGLPFEPGLVNGPQFGAALLVQNTVAVNGVAFRRDAFLQAGGFDETLWYTADWDFYLKMARIGAIDVRPEVTTAYRVHGNAQTIAASRDIGEFRRQINEVIDRHLLAFTSPRSAVERRVRASVEVNCALALAASGGKAGLLRTLLQLLQLGPRQVLRFFDETRLIDRLRPRLRLALTGGL